MQTDVDPRVDMKNSTKHMLQYIHSLFQLTKLTPSAIHIELMEYDTPLQRACFVHSISLSFRLKLLHLM
jgi:hypothetical protein